MVTRLGLRNFRSCAATEVELSPVTVLVGKNNSGKTNICQALRFLSIAASADSLDDAAHSLGIPPQEVATRYSASQPVGLQVDARVPHDGQEVEFRYSLVMQASDVGAAPGFVLNVVSERLCAEIGGGEWCFIDREGADVTLLHETRAQANAPDRFVKTTAPPSSDDDRAPVRPR